jgi:hypothetical protein
VIAGDGFGVGSMSVLEGACTLMSKCWIGDGPSDFVEMHKCGNEKGNE